MNLNAIKRSCKAAGRAIIFNTPGGQWITNGNAAFLIRGVRIDADSIPHLFNLTEKQIAKMTIASRHEPDPRYTQEPYPEEENAEEIGAAYYPGTDAACVALKTVRGVIWIMESEVSHIKPDRRSYAVRWLDGAPPALVAVYNGLLCEALVLPLHNQYQDALNRMAARLAGQTWRWPDPEEEAAEAEAAAERLAREMSEGEDV